MRYYRWPFIVILGFFAISCAKGGTYPLSLGYHPARVIPSLQQKIGPTLAIAPFRDERQETLYIGVHTPLLGNSTYFKSDPFPLEKAIKGALTEGLLERQGVKTVSEIWDGRPESLKDLVADSILMIEIKKFWTEGKASLSGTHTKTTIHLVIHLGVKKEGKVFTRNVEVEREKTVFRLTPERMEQMIDQLLTDIFDDFFSKPY